ncbi:hypothetical protein DPMN_075040 [Dreissena polymorpha]|uniref:Secreted protein n=1 Tax=Dreissena polymorpha TaxID=45954 RepID=A0A9D3YG29_DREPO|nr:hypothetical protein DPMN_075040 [Dreissena polymorpha]
MSLSTAALLGLLFSDTVSVSDYHSGGCGFNPPSELRIFHNNGDEENMNCEHANGSELCVMISGSRSCSGRQ